MEFYINDEKIDATLEGEKTVGDVLKSFEMICHENEAEVIGISISGKQITAENFDEEAKSALKGDEVFSFNVVTKGAVYESFSKLSALFKNLSERMESIPLDLQTGRDKEANAAITSLADSIEEFCHVAALASLFEDFIDIRIENLPFNDFFADFSSILKDFEEALKNEDTVSVGDLAEYEICPRLISIAKTLEEIKK